MNNMQEQLVSYVIFNYLSQHEEHRKQQQQRLQQQQQQQPPHYCNFNKSFVIIYVSVNENTNNERSESNFIKWTEQEIMLLYTQL